MDKALIEPTGGALNSQLSASKDAILTTNYLDDNIVQGRIFDISLAETLTAATPVYFTSEVTGSLNALFLTPIKINPTTGYCVLKIYEDTNYTGGTALTPQNRNRVSGATTQLTVNQGATGTTEGTLIFTKVYGSEGTRQSAGGGDGASSNSIILDPAKKYLYELTNSETGIVGIDAEFGEL